ncbi:hypothetical protein GLOTRDRAFT_46637 [Gloeophyllum trabeum ATCC 11539]|uniref:Uncharacterized protein n=1 Tax=Gloeophyllum trabeum (strain ATCC 11539 / FP-39264 / Madison 617) TaxID=670483 RepID=S7PYT3_GLOTA|nr:uncharacterized protein GLOTRDRAFT_46637 [Gloeophyllum trabeum ATCC 11539]EPQ52806.1 hypothetical protein GLOTRDRAFT_46637 [Gloeophyllum trabeum ATCC 11539]
MDIEHNVTASTPLTSTSQFIQADDDDLDEDDIPAFTHPSIQPASPSPDKGKARAPEQLAPPSGSVPSVSGNIGSSSGGGVKPSRQTVGGVQVETRYTGADTLDEPVTATIVRCSSFSP